MTLVVSDDNGGEGMDTLQIKVAGNAGVRTTDRRLTCERPHDHGGVRDDLFSDTGDQFRR